MIIHISGPSGSGKSTLGDKLFEKFEKCGDKVIIIDMDDIRGKYIRENMEQKR